MSNTIQAISHALSADVMALNAISHNIANINTAGFRAEHAVPKFQSHLDDYSVARSVDLRDGPVLETGRGLDLALRGRGFFVAQRGQETVLIRSGQLHLDSEGNVTSGHGDLILSESGSLMLANAAVRIDESGQIWLGKQRLDRIKVTDVVDPSRLMAVDGGYRYDGDFAEFTGSIQQGMLEQSNVDSAEESIHMMELTRHIESVQRAISIYDRAMDAGINRLGDN